MYYRCIRRISDKKLQLEIAKSLEILNPNELQLFATFAIFPRCAQIPVKVSCFLLIFIK